MLVQVDSPVLLICAWYLTVCICIEEANFSRPHLARLILILPDKCFFTIFAEIQPAQMVQNASHNVEIATFPRWKFAKCTGEKCPDSENIACLRREAGWGVRSGCFHQRVLRANEATAFWGKLHQTELNP